MESPQRFLNTQSSDSDLSVGQRHPPVQGLGPGLYLEMRLREICLKLVIIFTLAKQVILTEIILNNLIENQFFVLYFYPTFLMNLTFLFVCVLELDCQQDYCNGKLIISLRQRNFHLNVDCNPGMHWFCFTLLCDWSRKLAPLSLPIRCKIKTNPDLVACLFPLHREFDCFHFKFLLALGGIIPQVRKGIS